MSDNFFDRYDIFDAGSLRNRIITALANESVTVAMNDSPGLMTAPSNYTGSSPAHSSLFDFLTPSESRSGL